MGTSPGKQEIDERMARFEEVCRDAGVRLTHQRLEVFRELARSSDHPDAELVYRRVRERMPTVSLDTVYRTLWMLSEHGLVTTIGASRERTRFDANLTRHHHFVCVSCGMTRDFYSEELNTLRLPRSAKSYGTIEQTLVEVRGTCRVCEAKAAEPKADTKSEYEQETER